MNISEEAVETAAKASFEFMEDMEWGLANFLDKTLFRDAARRTLEAAAPHLMAQAWDEGHESGFWNGRLSQLTVPYDAPEPEIGVAHAKSHNPYRLAGVGE